MKKAYLILLVLPFLALGKIRSPKKLDVTIVMGHERSKQIWGTYKQSKNEVWYIGRGKKRKIRRSNISSKVMLSKGKFYLVRPTELEGTTKMAIQAIPYTRKKRKKEIDLNINDSKPELLELFQTDIQKHLALDEVSAEDIKFKSYKCKRVPRKIECRLKLQVEI